MDEDHNDMPEVVNFFSKRAKFVPKMSAEKLEAASKLLEEIHGENKCPLPEDIEYVPAKKRSRRKASAKEKSVEPEEITLEDNAPDVPSTSKLTLSAAAKRRLKKFQKERQMELQSIEEANQKVLSSLNTSGINDIEDVDVDNFDRVNVLTISYLSDISRLKCHEHDKFSTILPKVADMFKLKVTEFLLCLRDKNIEVEDTPKSLNITHTDILECIPYKADGKRETEYDVDKLKLFFQSSDSKKKTEMLVHKLEKMQDVMEKYSKTRNIPLDQLAFEFDGEQLSGTETPEDMDMEPGSCIDVTVLTADDIKSRKAAEKRKNATASVITVESDSNDSDLIFLD